LEHLCCSEVSISPLFRWPNSVCHFSGDDACLQDALEHTAYFAKEYTKVNGINERFGLFVIFHWRTSNCQL
jgi:hypothetical protein